METRDQMSGSQKLKTGGGVVSKGAAWGNLGVMELFCVMMMAVDTSLHAFVQTHRTVYHKK